MWATLEKWWVSVVFFVGVSHMSYVNAQKGHVATESLGYATKNVWFYGTDSEISRRQMVRFFAIEMLMGLRVSAMKIRLIVVGL